MPQYDKCSLCGGSGSLLCKDCDCTTCQKTGKVRKKERIKVKCSRDSCNRGYISCSRCGATGEIPTKKWLLFPSTTICPTCNGKKKIACRTCEGKGTVEKEQDVDKKCEKCKGTGYLPTCQKCGGKRKIQCQSCSGTGKVENKLFKYFDSLPNDRLYFEYEKRQREVQTLEVQIQTLEAQRNKLEVELEHAMHYGSGPNYTAVHGLWGDAGDRIIPFEKRISDLKSEMTKIDEIIQSR